MDDRAEAVGHWISHHPVDASRRRDRVVAVEVAHLPPADLARRHHPVIVERREREGRPATSDEDAGRHADVPHAYTHRRNRGRPHQCHHPQVVPGMIRHRGDLHDIGIQGGEPGVERLEIDGRLVKIVVADDPLRRAIAWHALGDIILEIDVIGPLDDRRSQHQPAGFLGLPPASTIRCAAAGGNHGAVSFPEQTRHLHGPLDVIKPQFHQADAVVGQILVFGDDVPMTAPSDADADHVDFRRKWFRCGGTAGRGPAATARGRWAGRGGSGVIREPSSGRARAHRPPPARAGRRL